VGEELAGDVAEVGDAEVGAEIDQESDVVYLGVLVVVREEGESGRDTCAISPRPITPIRKICFDIFQISFIQRS